MAQHNLATVLTLEEIPAVIRQKKLGDLTRSDRRVIAGMLFIKELVQKSYQQQARIMQATIRRKREEGYCGGFVYCLEYTGKAYMCAKCKKQKANPNYSRKMSEYGRIRQAERAKERQSKTSVA